MMITMMVIYVEYKMVITNPKIDNSKYITLKQLWEDIVKNVRNVC
nr:V-type Ig domain protein [Oriental turtle dovepox virus]